MMIKVICDIEANGLLIEATKIHCIVCKDYETDKLYKFSNTPLTELDITNDFMAFAKKVDVWVGHNWLGYDLFVLNRLLGLEIKARQVEDTLVMSRLFTSGKFRTHSIEAWMKRMGGDVEKVKNEDWTVLTPLMLERCISDTEFNVRLYARLLNEGRGFTKTSIRLEHNAQYLLTKQKIRGVKIDVRKAEKMLLDCHRRANTIRELVQKEYPPVRKNKRTFRPRMVGGKDGKTQQRMHGQDKRTLDRNLHDRNRDGTYTLYFMQDFNLDSPTQCVERLNAAGWQPIEFNKLSKTQEEKGWDVGTPKVNEINLETLPDDAPQGALLISDYKMLVNRERTARGWLDKLGTDGRLHGDVFSVGAWTQRCSHANPQTANIPSVRYDDAGKMLYGVEGRYGADSRECWTVDDTKTRRIVGVDAKAIQLRILAHYMDDPVYTERILNENPHEVHRELLGFPITDEYYDVAKRWMYAWLLGAGYKKLGRMMGGGYGDAIDAENLMLDRLPGLAGLKAIQEKDARRGWFRGLDGRKVPAKSNHLVMSGYLQSGEAIVMKKAYIEACVKLKELDADIVLFVHDEFQADCHLTNVEKCGTIMVEAINNTTDYFGLRCPMAGDTPKVGLTWAETH